MGFEGVAFLFLLGAVAAAVAWMVYVAKFNIDYYRKVNSNMTVADNITNNNITLKNTLTVDQYTICYQALVVSLLLYFSFKYHFAK
jgi:divalent metal cation (Fe/Co/Zn/Cd) transporter